MGLRGKDTATAGQPEMTWGTPPVDFNRYRADYQEEDGTSDKFLPDIGIQPANDGGLFAAGHVFHVKAMSRTCDRRVMSPTSCQLI